MKGVEPTSLVTEFIAAHSEQRAPAIASDTAEEVARAVNVLLTMGNLDAAQHGVRSLLQTHPDMGYARNLCAVFERLPAAAPSGFTDDPASSFQLVRRPEADTLLVCFCDYNHHLGAPLSLIHRWLGLLSASIVYLRDFQRVFHLLGNPSLGVHREATVAALRLQAAAVGARRIVCMGTSGGVYPSLLYGLELGAERVLAIAGMTNLSVEFNEHLHSAEKTARLQRRLPNLATDLRKAYATAASPPKVRLLFGRENWDDRLHAEHLSGLPGVSVEAVEDCATHSVTPILLKREALDGLLQWLTQDAAD
jgi:hypothetical protein